MSICLMKGLFPHKKARKYDLAAIMRVRQVADFDRIFKKDKGNESERVKKRVLGESTLYKHS